MEMYLITIMWWQTPIWMDCISPGHPRDEVMDAVYDDLVYAFENVRVNDGAMNVNRISWPVLSPGLPCRKLPGKNITTKTTAGREVFNTAILTGDYVMGKAMIVSEFRSLFISRTWQATRMCCVPPL